MTEFFLLKTQRLIEKKILLITGIRYLVTNKLPQMNNGKYHYYCQQYTTIATKHGKLSDFYRSLDAQIFCWHLQLLFPALVFTMSTYIGYSFVSAGKYEL